jgi:hypothetical protein
MYIRTYIVASSRTEDNSSQDHLAGVPIYSSRTPIQDNGFHQISLRACSRRLCGLSSPLGGSRKGSRMWRTEYDCCVCHAHVTIKPSSRTDPKSSGLPPYHPLVTAQGFNATAVNAALRADAVDITKAGYNLRGESPASTAPNMYARLTYCCSRPLWSRTEYQRPRQ